MSQRFFILFSIKLKVDLDVIIVMIMTTGKAINSFDLKTFSLQHLYN